MLSLVGFAGLLDRPGPLRGYKKDRKVRKMSDSSSQNDDFYTKSDKNILNVLLEMMDLADDGGRYCILEITIYGRCTRK